jgi:uncharacterized protein (TIGR02996 family)
VVIVLTAAEVEDCVNVHTRNSARLLRAVLESPFDRAVKEAYADALLGSADPADRRRGELVAVMCRYAADADPGAAVPADRMPALAALQAARKKRGGELLREFGPAWLGVGGMPFACEWECGFVRRVTGRHLPVARNLTDLCRRHPVTGVRVSDRRPAHLPSFPEAVWVWAFPRELGDDPADAAYTDWALPRHLLPLVRRWEPADVRPPLAVAQDLDAVVGFHTEDAAHDALSRALVCFHRAEAGLTNTDPWQEPDRAVRQ